MMNLNIVQRQVDTTHSKKKHFALYDTVKLKFLTDFIYNEIGDFSYNHFRIKKIENTGILIYLEKLS